MVHDQMQIYGDIFLYYYGTDKFLENEWEPPPLSRHLWPLPAR